jgi:hypothetical protein
MLDPGAVNATIRGTRLDGDLKADPEVPGLWRMGRRGLKGERRTLKGAV